MGNVKASYNFIQAFHLNKDIALIDIGTNIGELPFTLYQEGYTNVCGTDISVESIVHGKKQFPQIQDKLFPCDGKHISFPDHSFDVVTMFDVIEHVTDIERFVQQEVYRILKPNGLFIFQTPNKLINILWVYMSNKSCMIPWWYEHCSLQSTRSLRRLLEGCGFRTVSLTKFNVDSEYNRKKMQNTFGGFGPTVLHIASRFPLFLYPSLFGSARK